MAKKTKEETSSEALVPAAATGVLFGKLASPEAALERATEAGYGVCPKVMSFKEAGQWIEARLQGEGAPVEVEDIATGEIRQIKTWVFSGGRGLRVALMGSYQLDHELPALVGKMVRITYLSQQDTRKGTRVKDYLIEFWDADAELHSVA